MEVHNNSVSTRECVCVFTWDIKAGIINSQFFRSQERLDIWFVCLFYLTAHQCHWQNKLASMQSVPGVNNDRAREIEGGVKGEAFNTVEKRWRRNQKKNYSKCESDRFQKFWMKM